MAITQGNAVPSLEKVEKNIPVGASVPVALIAIVQQVAAHTCCALQNLKEKIKKKTIKDFPAESVLAHVDWLTPELASVTGAKGFGP